MTPSQIAVDQTGNIFAVASGTSTIKELAAFVQHMVGGDYLNSDLQAKRLSTCTVLNPSDPNSPSYCLGMAKYGSFYGHNGQINGFNTLMVYDPTTRTTVVTWRRVRIRPPARRPPMRSRKS